MDADLLRAAHAAAAALAGAERRLDQAKSDYHDVIRRLHLAGASLREMAEALGLSHQRLHQIVRGAGGARRWRVRRTDPESCSFCHRARADVAHCIAGPGIGICDRCVVEARQLGTGEQTPVGAKFGPRCSFCGRGQHKVGPLAETGDARICTRCLELCEEIIEQLSSG